MTTILVTEKHDEKGNLYYVQSSLSEVFNYANCTLKVEQINDREILKINCPEEYKDVVCVEVADKVAEVIAIKYKNDFFKNGMNIQGLNNIEREIMYASLIAADLDEDKKYSFDKIKGSENIAIDGIFNFRLGALKKKWQDIIDYIPSCFLNTHLKDFIGYLLENKRKRVYVESGRVYDSHYRRLKRSQLLDGDKAKIVREILLSNCGEVRLTGQLPQEDEYYLREFYNDKIVFCSENSN